MQSYLDDDVGHPTQQASQQQGSHQRGQHESSPSLSSPLPPPPQSKAAGSLPRMEQPGEAATRTKGASKAAAAHKRLTKDLVENCAVLRLQLSRREGAVGTAFGDGGGTAVVTRIASAEFLFGTGFK